MPDYWQKGIKFQIIGIKIKDC